MEDIYHILLEIKETSGKTLAKVEALQADNTDTRSRLSTLERRAAFHTGVAATVGAFFGAYWDKALALITGSA